MAMLSPHCRVSLQDKNAFRSLWCYINANPYQSFNASSPYTLQIPLVDKSFRPVYSLKNRSDSSNYIFRVSGPALRENYYANARWHSIINSNWLQLANDIPNWKTAIMKNQMTLKYHVQVDDGYWAMKFEDQWGDFSAQEKFEKKKIEYGLINTYLTGVENAGKGFFSVKYMDADGKEVQGIKIDRLDDKVQSGAYIEDSQEANSHILYSLGFDGRLIGSTPAKALGAGSGSDIREAWNILITVGKPKQDKILEPLNFSSAYNGWKGKNGKPLKFWFKNYYIQTLDAVAPADRNSQAQGQTQTKMVQ